MEFFRIEPWTEKAATIDRGEVASVIPESPIHSKIGWD
jgi:hypothetical protein